MNRAEVESSTMEWLVMKLKALEVEIASQKQTTDLMYRLLMAQASVPAPVPSPVPAPAYATPPIDASPAVATQTSLPMSLPKNSPMVRMDLPHRWAVT